MTKELKWELKQANRMAHHVKSKLRSYSHYRVCGSYRRKLKTVADLDIVVVAENADDMIESIHQMADKILASGKRTIRILMYEGMQVDFMIVQESQFESACLHFTGSKWTNIKCRKVAKIMGFKLNEYGLFDSSGEKIESTEKGILTKLRMLKFLDPVSRS